MYLAEPQTLDDADLIGSFTGDDSNMMVGETEFINQTHEVWCRSRTVLTDNMYWAGNTRYSCNPTYLKMNPIQPRIFAQELEVIDPQSSVKTVVTGGVYPDPSKVVTDVQRYICEQIY
ncbi:uncharacterized protein LOC135941738 [Cloeon dipterum]|uniref:uncharacterized protein LOC135941738 n=1 Tax=Cloeon dipterum TaxID=197152 RepID=UPI00321F8DEA